MDEPTYIFKKGVGWVVSLNPGWESLINQPWIYLSSFSTILGPGHGDGNWYMYPETCRSWNIIDCLGENLKVGDVIPYGPSEYRYVLSVTPTNDRATKIECKIFFCNGKIQDSHFTISSDLPFRCVARP